MLRHYSNPLIVFLRKIQIPLAWGHTALWDLLALLGSPHPPPDTHSACFIHPSLSGLLAFSFHAPGLSVPPLECSAQIFACLTPWLFTSSSERASLATAHIYVWYKSPSQLTWTPHSKLGCSVETNDVTHTLRECEWIYYSHNVTFWETRTGAQAGQKLAWNSGGKRPVQLLLC